MLRRCVPRVLAMAAAASAVSAVSVSAAMSLTPTSPFPCSRAPWSPPSSAAGLWPADRGPLAGVWLGFQSLLRSSRAIYTFSVNSLDYKISVLKYDVQSEQYFEILSKVHARAAKRILELCETNGGIYIKAGQFIASMQHMPKEFVSTLSVLQDKASFWHFRLMEQVFLEEFGKNVSELYEEFDEEPIAAASLAQVHHAVLKNGQEVAVKIRQPTTLDPAQQRFVDLMVQYPGLQQQFEIDIATMAFLSKAIAWLFPDYQFEWIVPEFKETLSRELDFVQEANNAERTAKSFTHKMGVSIPRVFRELTTKRVLTMEFMKGCKVDDVKSLERAGIDPLEVATLLVEVFAEMIFCHGYVHGDPHPGNILVHKHPSQIGKHNFDLVLLDHGLYRELEEKFRINYCRLWKALILLDPNELQEAGKLLGAGDYYRYFPVIFTGRTLSSKSGLGQLMSPEEQKALKEEVRRFTMGDISQWMEGLPREFLTVLRTDGLLRSITNKLGASRRTRLMAYVKYAAIGFRLEHRGEPSLQTQGLRAYAKAQLEYTHLWLRLEVVDLAYKGSLLYKAILRHLIRLSSKVQLLLAWRGSPALS